MQDADAQERHAAGHSQPSTLLMHWPLVRRSRLHVRVSVHCNLAWAAGPRALYNQGSCFRIAREADCMRLLPWQFRSSSPSTCVAVVVTRDCCRFYDNSVCLIVRHGRGRMTSDATAFSYRCMLSRLQRFRFSGRGRFSCTPHEPACIKGEATQDTLHRRCCQVMLTKVTPC